MKKSEFKEMIKEGVKEVLVEEGVLKGVISEVVKAVGVIQAEQKLNTPEQSSAHQASVQAAEKQKQKLAETRKKMLDVIGKDSFGGVDLFEGTTPISKAGNPSAPSGPSSALEGVAPDDEGVDISGFLDGAKIWKQLLK